MLPAGAHVGPLPAAVLFQRTFVAGATTAAPRHGLHPSRQRLLGIDDFAKAQTLVDRFEVNRLHRKLDQYARKLCPVVRQFRSGIHWSLMPLEYATDIVFRIREDLQLLYRPLVRTVIHAVKADNVATFLGRKLDPRFAGEAGNDFHTRIEGTRVRHDLGPVALKMYDQHGSVLRIESTVNDVTFFKHHRKVEFTRPRRSMSIVHGQTP